MGANRSHPIPGPRTRGGRTPGYGPDHDEATPSARRGGPDPSADLPRPPGQHRVRLGPAWGPSGPLFLLQRIPRGVLPRPPGVGGSRVSENPGRGCVIKDTALGGEMTPVLPGYRTKILDGNHLPGTEHRILELRTMQAGALPGQALVVSDPRLMLAIDAMPLRGRSRPGAVAVGSGAGDRRGEGPLDHGSQLLHHRLSLRDRPSR